MKKYELWFHNGYECEVVEIFDNEKEALDYKEEWENEGNLDYEEYLEIIEV